MTVDSRFSSWLVTSIRKRVQEVVGSSALLQVPGYSPAAKPTDSEWYALTFLNMPKDPSRLDWWVGGVLFQITCFSRNAVSRSDRDPDRPFAMSGVVREALEGKGLSIYEYGDGDAWHTAMRVGPAQEQYLDESRMPSRGEGVSNVHAVALTFRGYLANT